MKITYLDHSGFCVELQKHIIIFDYVEGQLPYLNEEKLIYFFVTHSHKDHLHPHLSTVLKQYPNALAIVSDDIKDLKDASVQFVKENEVYDIDEMVVETYHSTDQGVAYLVTVEQRAIFHAGDLHWWHWQGEPEADLMVMQQAYFTELAKLQGRTIDLAFLVLDPRLEDAYWMGFDAFMRNSDVRHAIPMHCWGNYELMQALLKQECSVPYRNRIMTYDHAGEQIEIGGN